MVRTNVFAYTSSLIHISGILCHEGQFTPVETECMQDVLSQYRAASGISQEDLEGIVLGVAKQDGFWEDITRAVPGRCICSVLDHAQLLFDPYRDKGDWSNKEDLRLKKFFDQCLDWYEISRGMQCSAAACCNRYHRHLVPRPWSEEEEACLTQVMQVLEEEGKTPDNTPKFWKMVSERLDGTRTCDQCWDKWIVKSGGRTRWRDTDAKTLVKKIARLNLDHKNNIPWAELIDECWSMWTAEQLQGKWAALKAKAKVDGGMMHHGKYKVYLSAGTLLMIT
ncbi:hypothetical protein V8E53_002804 [Lactarius tabidus]